MGRPATTNKKILVKFLVIALTTVIAVQADSSESHGSPVEKLVTSGKSEEPRVELVEVKELAKIEIAPEKTTSLEAKSAIVDVAPEASAPKVQSSGALSSSKQIDTEAELKASALSEASSRKGRAEGGSEVAPKSDDSSNVAVLAEKPAEKPTEKATTAKLEPKAAPKPAKQPVPAGKNGAKKLPPNLGTVTSTGSGGPSHYMSKHDAYSAIAEKHGAVVESMKKSDKRQLQSSFGGIQKASGIGDMLSPFKGVTDSGLARTLGASMRSIMKSKYSVPAYVASALLGAVALMAFYESPISPLPVPALPEPPIGRFPPEMPVLPPNLQVPFRTNQRNQYDQQQQQINYNQRSHLEQGNQQVLFPGNNVAQQRQMNNPSGPAQIAANILSVGKLQNAQRKSSIDYDQSSMRSFFSAPIATTPKAAPANPKSNSILSFLGLGGSTSGSEVQQATGLNLNQGQASSNGQAVAQLALAAAANSLEPKGSQQNALSNSHIINKVRSYFTKQASPSGSSSSAGISNVLPYEQYQKMSLIQAVMKDTAFLPGFFSPTRKSGGSTNAKSLTLTTSKPAARMQTGNEMPMMNVQHQQQINVAPKSQNQANSGYGLMKAILETFASGVSQRSAPSSGSQTADKKSGDEQSSATSLLSDIVSTYKAVNSGNIEQRLAEQASSKSSSQPIHSQNNQQQSVSVNQQSAINESQVSGRSSDAPISSEVDNPAQVVSSSSSKQAGSVAPAPSSENSHVRKTRSIGIEYPIEGSYYELAQAQQQPSRAARINNLVDFVADSYTQNRLLFNLIMNQVGLNQAVPYVEQILAPVNKQ